MESGRPLPHRRRNRLVNATTSLEILSQVRPTKSKANAGSTPLELFQALRRDLILSKDASNVHHRLEPLVVRDLGGRIVSLETEREELLRYGKVLTFPIGGHIGTMV
jgi:hypothetical protein